MRASTCLMLAVGLVAACRGAGGEGGLTSMLGRHEAPGPYRATLTLRGVLRLQLPAGVGPRDALVGANALRVKELAVWQGQFLHGALHTALRPSIEGIAALAGTPEVRLLEARALEGGAAEITYELKDLLLSDRPLAKPLALVLPREVTSVFQKSLVAGGERNGCSRESQVAEDHLFFFWDPTRAGCPLGPDDLAEVTATVEPQPLAPPSRPDYDGMKGSADDAGRLRIVWIIGDDHAYGAGDTSAEAYAVARSRLEELGFREKGRLDGGRQGALFHFREGKLAATLELRLVDPTSFEFVRASAAALETADVFLCNGQTGFGNYLDLPRFERLLGRPLRLPADKSQVYGFNGASPFAFGASELFHRKATTGDPRGLARLDVVTTTPLRVPSKDAVVGVDVVLLQALLLGQRPTWTDIVRRMAAAAGDGRVLSYVSGDE